MTEIFRNEISRQGWVASAIQAVADRIHSAPDRRAAAAGLTVTRVGLTGRAYRDPRFNTRRNRGE